MYIVIRQFVPDDNWMQTGPEFEFDHQAYAHIDGQLHCAYELSRRAKYKVVDLDACPSRADESVTEPDADQLHPEVQKAGATEPPSEYSILGVYNGYTIAKKDGLFHAIKDGRDICGAYGNRASLIGAIDLFG